MRRLAIWAVLLVVLSACSRENPNPVAAASGAPVIVISIDTLRADRLPAYGYRGVETPAIDALRADGILFQNAWSHAPLTLPSHVSMLTGRIPPSTGVRNNLGSTFDGSRMETLPAALKKKGYATGAAVSSYVLRRETGLGALFDFYDDRIVRQGGVAVGALQRSGFETEAIAERWIGERGAEPFFFMLHLFEPHTPYDAPEPYRGRTSNPYDAEIAASDAIVAKFVAFLKEKGLYDKSTIVLLSDHGEGLNDHGEEEHGIFLYRETLQVPLIVKLPGGERRGTSVTEPVGLFDLFPTIAKLAGVETPAGVEGNSLFEIAGKPARAIYSETLYPRIHLGWSDLRSLMNGRHHYIRAPRAELYDLEADPQEKKNIAADERRTAASMREAVEKFVKPEDATPAAIDPEEAKKLAALGYLSAPSNATGPLRDPKDGIADLNAIRRAEREAASRPAEAAAIYRDALARNPNYTDGWVLLAEAQQRLGHYRDAIASFRRAIQLAPTTVREHAVTIAGMHLNLGELDAAAENARLALESDPVQANVLLGRVSLARRDFQSARRSAEAALAIQAEHAQAGVLLAQALAGLGAGADALRLLDTIDQQHAEPVSLLEFVRGDLLARSGRVPEARAAFEREIRDFPHDREAYAGLAVIHLLGGNGAAADAVMQKMVTALPGRDSMLFAAKTFEDLGDSARAAAWRRRAR